MEVVDFNELVWDNIGENYTPDTPEHRYGGPIPIFLYGEMAMWTNIDTFFKAGGCKQQVDWKFRHSNAVTQEEFVALHNKGTSVKAKLAYPDIMMRKPVVELRGVSDLTPRKVSGSIITVSLKGLQEFDKYYYHQYRTYRTRVVLEHNKASEYSWAYSYLFPVKTFAEKASNTIDTQEDFWIPSSSYTLEPFKRGTNILYGKDGNSRNIEVYTR